MISVIKKSIFSLKNAHLIRYMIASAFLAVFVFFLAVVLVTLLTGYLLEFEIGWLDNVISALVGLVLGLGGWFVLPAFTVLIAGLFQERIIYRIEKVEYPEIVRETGPGLWPDFWHDIKFTVWALFLNILILPLYLLAIGFPISILLNTYLLGREFFETTAGYHIGKPGAKKLIKKNWQSVYGAGLLITLLTLVPILNLFVPFLAVIIMLHTYHQLR